jgi:PhnB protein
MQVHPYLNFNGNCKEAFQFYEKALGGKIEMIQTHEDSPMKDHVPPNWNEKILHARMRIGDTILMASDSPPDAYRKPQGLYVSLNIEEPEDADRIYNSLVKGGSAQMPIQETFWAKRFAMLSDRYGTPWMINCMKPEMATAGA